MADANNVDAETRKLIAEARSRWLTVLEILKLIHQLQELQEQLPNRPDSGTLHLYDKDVVRNFRKDGYKWKKETHKKLKDKSVYVLNCCYASATDDALFRRRIYWTLEGENQNRRLVHYRKEADPSPSAANEDEAPKCESNHDIKPWQQHVTQEQHRLKYVAPIDLWNMDLISSTEVFELEPQDEPALPKSEEEWKTFISDLEDEHDIYELHWNAAVTIQACIRGFMARSWYRHLKATNEEEAQQVAAHIDQRNIDSISWADVFELEPQELEKPEEQPAVDDPLKLEEGFDDDVFEKWLKEM